MRGNLVVFATICSLQQASRPISPDYTWQSTLRFTVSYALRRFLRCSEQHFHFRAASKLWFCRCRSPFVRVVHVLWTSFLSNYHKVQCTTDMQVRRKWNIFWTWLYKVRQLPLRFVFPLLLTFLVIFATFLSGIWENEVLLIIPLRWYCLGNNPSERSNSRGSLSRYENQSSWL